MRRNPALALQFKSDKTNRKKDVLFHFLVGTLLVFVLLATTAPLLTQVGLALWHGFDNLKSNLSPKKTVALNPIAQSLKDQLKSKIDPSIFEIKDVLELDPYSLQLTSRDSVIALFSSLTDVDKQVSSLQTLLVKSRIEAKRIKKIDLRFDKTVVEYEK